MCIAYMQSIGKLPNLQDAERVKAAGRENCVIWVSWGKPQGQAAEIGFAEPSDDDFAAAQAAEGDIGSIVEGFFSFYHNMFRKDRECDGEPSVRHNGRPPNTRQHVISVWKGGLTDRSVPVDQDSGSKRRIERRNEEARMKVSERTELSQGGDSAMSGVEQSEQTTINEEIENALLQEEQTPTVGTQPREAKGRGRNRLLPAEELPRGPARDGFAQPERWSKSDLVVQDPFLHDKVRDAWTCATSRGLISVESCQNCAVALGRQNFDRITGVSPKTSEHPLFQTTHLYLFIRSWIVRLTFLREASL